MKNLPIYGDFLEGLQEKILELYYFKTAYTARIIC